MIRKFGAKQLTEVTHKNVRILISYATPVAVFDGVTLYRTERKYSVTTSKHITYYLSQLLKEGHEFEVVTVPQRVINDARYSGTISTVAPTGN